jgi:hypothetical protein
MEQVRKEVYVPLAWLAEMDECSAPNALADAVGDRYLYRHSPIYARVRDAAIDLGYGFSAEDTPLWRDYQSLALLTLDRIVNGRIIPYFDNGQALRRLMEKDPATALPPGFIVSNVKQNRAFHESAHCVAYAVLRQNAATLRAVSRSENEQFVLEAILAESFANTAESIGSAFDMSISHRVFYALNSYMSSSKKATEPLERARVELGEEMRFRVLFTSYFESNLASEPPTDTVYRRVAQAAVCPSEQAALAKEITDIGFQLNVGFRNNTTPVYFGLLGYKEEYAALTRANWLEQATHQEAIRHIAGMLAATCTTDVAQEVCAQ